MRATAAMACAAMAIVSMNATMPRTRSGIDIDTRDQNADGRTHIASVSAARRAMLRRGMRDSTNHAGSLPSSRSLDHTMPSPHSVQAPCDSPRDSLAAIVASSV